MGGEKLGKSRLEIFCRCKHITDDKLQVTEDVVHHKNVFFEGIFS